MAFNLNKSQKPEVELLKNNIDEMINIYGVNCNFIYTNKMNKDFVLRDFSHFTATQDAFELYLLPEDTSNWQNDLQWDVFGLNNLRTISFFMSSVTYERIKETFGSEKFDGLLNSLLVMPNGAILEISDIDFDFEGGNNLFLFSDSKSVYRITTRMYQTSKQDEIDIKDDPQTSEIVEKTIEDGLLEIEYNEDEIINKSYQELEEYFSNLEDNKEEQDTEGQKISNSDSVFGSLG
jgi:hypothetical protein